MPKPVAPYARVSRPDQKLDAQLDALRAWAATRGLEVQVYQDHGISGRTADRPGLEAAMAAARRGQVGAVIVHRLDRFGRSLSDLLRLTGELEAAGVDFVSLEDGLDTSTAVGRLFFQIRGAFAQYEHELIRERTRDSLVAARARGKRLGRPPRALDTAALYAEHQAGASIASLARRHECSRSAVRSALARAR